MAPQGGNLQVLGRNTEHLGNWGGMDPFVGGINKYPLIAQDVLLAGVLWRLHQCLLMLHYDAEGSSALPQDTVPQTKMDTGPMKDNIFGSEAFILLTKMEMHALPAQRISKFP